MARIEILVEEQSMEELLRILIPKFAPERWVLDENYFIRPHQGKQDLQKSIPQKVKTFSRWHEPAAIVIVQDQDSAECVELKNRLISLCGDIKIPLLVRIVCRELEAWYIGCPKAIESAYPKFKAKNLISKSKYRNPDKLNNAKQELRKLLPEYAMIDSAKRITPHIVIEECSSESLAQFVSGMKRIFDSMNP